MKKSKFTAALGAAILIAMVIMTMLVGCSIVDEVMDSDKNTEMKFKEDYLVGVFYTLGRDLNELLPKNFTDPDFCGVYIESTQGYIQMISGQYLHNIKIATTNKVVAPGGTIDIEATFYFTHELRDETIGANLIYYNTETNSLRSDAAGSSMALGTVGISGLSYSQSLKANTTDENGVTTEITYSAKTKLNMIYIDNLVSARMLKYDSSDNLLGVDELALNVDSHSVALDKDCAYTVIAEEYEVMHAGGHNNIEKGQRYIRRTLIERTTDNEQLHSLKVPRGNGLVRSLCVKMEWK